MRHGILRQTQNWQLHSCYVLPRTAFANE